MSVSVSVNYRMLRKGRWLVRAWRASDKQSAYWTVRSEREAVDLRTMLHGQVLQGIDVVAARQQARSHTEAPLIQDAIPQEITRLVEEREIGGGTQANLRSAFNVWVKPVLGAKRVDTVTAEDVGTVIAAIKRADKASVLKTVLKPLRSFFRRYAKAHGGFVNPTADLRDYLGAALRQR